MKKNLLLVLLGVVLGSTGYIGFDYAITPDATVIEEAEGVLLLEGTFYDADVAHKASGSFAIQADGMGGRTIMLSNDFQVANAPDPHVYVNGEKIAKNFWKGGQVFDIPNFISEDITEVKIFCEIAGIDLGLTEFVDLH